MPNHFHLLLKTGQTPIATLIRLYREFVQKEAGQGRRRELRYLRVFCESMHLTEQPR
jgi:hypothetical protein